MLKDALMMALCTLMCWFISGKVSYRNIQTNLPCRIYAAVSRSSTNRMNRITLSARCSHSFTLLHCVAVCIDANTILYLHTLSHHTTANSCLHIEWTIISKYNSFCFKCWQVSVRESVHSLTEIRISKWLLKSILYKVFTNNDIYRFECLPATNATGCCKVYGFCMVGEWCKGRQTKWKQSSCSDRHTQNVRQPLQ